MLVVVLSVTVAGGLLARELYRRPDQPDPGGGTVAPSTTNDGVPRELPGPGRVEVTADAAGHPDGNTVREVLQSYFDAVNSKDYRAWTTTVSEERRSKMPESRWRHDFQSTKDGTITVYRIEPGAQSTLRVLVRFISTQSLDEAPPDFKQPCIRWNLMLPLKFEQGQYRIDVTDGASALRAKC